MMKFILKTFLLLLLLFTGILLGIQHANVNMKKMQGYDDPNMYSAFTINKTTDGELNASILGKEVQTSSFEEKKQTIEDMKAFNLFSSAGKKLSGAVTTFFQKIAGSLEETE